MTPHGESAWSMHTDGGAKMSPTSHLGPLDAEASRLRTGSGSCCCLLRAISFLEKLISRSNSRSKSISVLLTDVRTSVDRLAVFIKCERCTSRVEQNAVFAMVVRQISFICGKTAAYYKDMEQNSSADTDQTSAISQKSELEFSSTLSASPLDIFVSTYRVNTREKLHLLRSLVTLQIAEIQQHINTIRTRCLKQPDQDQAKILIEAESHIKLARANMHHL